MPENYNLDTSGTNILHAITDGYATVERNHLKNGLVPNAADKPETSGKRLVSR